ncbi:TBC domain containing protein [Trichomonas vaginalis G3]|uniref:TBC domain containing protein n=1 Tax=Trichomonas vaginalis (strain ATCC PRA-98 / G3) TaxID=412133 RepID=A2DHN7_TRIV3|nr:positive regulation of ER to Golgi vesicle-mediated transport [Trichomonas vaginalis G3]EAY20085.1 TBC domain containing protein [Trichomonas vaginalis G3]KAI5528038.1 positive regulation of ER to Golgi vesicle-mediated transport [Trichomonas vaginalis G3]|eukprot:XP_001581071.1 TBC domain containing protein [Trichomonas vaginalis G3]
MTETADFYKELFQSGKVENKKRRAIWKEVLDIPSSFTPTIAPTTDHRDFKQVEKDVNRSFLHLQDSDFKTRRRQQLLNVILSVLERHAPLHYCQGIHHIASIILTFAREPLAMLIFERLALGPLLPFLQENLEGLASMMNFVMPIIKLVDPELWQHFDENDFDTSYYTAPYIVSWFVPQASSLEVALKYLDFFVISNPIMPVYLIVAYTLHRKSEFMSKYDYEAISQVSDNITHGIDPDVCINRAIEIFKQFPPVVVLNNNPKLFISKNLTLLNPRVDYPFPFPTFPKAQLLPHNIYEKHLSDEKSDSKLITGILSALTILGAIGLRILEL